MKYGQLEKKDINQIVKVFNNPDGTSYAVDGDYIWVTDSYRLIRMSKSGFELLKAGLLTKHDFAPWEADIRTFKTLIPERVEETGYKITVSPFTVDSDKTRIRLAFYPDGRMIGWEEGKQDFLIEGNLLMATKGRMLCAIYGDDIIGVFMPTTHQYLLKALEGYKLEQVGGDKR